MITKTKTSTQMATQDQQNNVQQSNSPLNVQTFKIHGMKHDLSESAFENNFAFENMNMRINIVDSDNTLLNLTNERGTLNTGLTLVGRPIYAANDLGTYQHANGVLMSREMLAQYYAKTRGDTDNIPEGTPPVYLYNYEERQKHYQPVSFGLTAKIPISSGLSVSSGLVYTRLRSDFTNIVGGYPLYKKQTLHYLGIPLSVQYHLWGYKGLKVYASAGGQVDFCVDTKVVMSGTEVSTDKDRPQWSVQGALGVQYNVIPLLGIYVEPGVKHYFNNHSYVRNFFKDKPTNFNLQIGLRLNVGN